ncbi:MAG: valine--pyruvate transaminase [Desulfobulbus sp.]|jgi:valine--pyruvate aminotransferase
MNLSAFGEKFSGGAGILSLMDDLGNALAQGGMIMMGGGNPGHIPEVQALMRERLLELAADDRELSRLIGIYDPPQGKREFCRAMAAMLRTTHGWPLTEENICLTNGSQSAFFLLFNLLAGPCADGRVRRILLPMAPEYIGYADLGLSEPFFVSAQPRIELMGEHLFKYRVDFDRLTITDDIAALCVSRPTNPTGNVLTDEEIRELSRLAAQHDIPLIIDSAYGLPFPGMIYTDVTPVWNEQMIVCMSLSKLGLPAVRTGIVIARREIVRLIAGANAVVNLATSSFGPMLTGGLVASGEINRISRDVIRPFYQRKMQLAMACIDELFTGFPYRVHVPEGAMFLWLWFPGLPQTSLRLYERLKARGVVVVAGEYFFPGLEPGWPHMHECLRITYSQDEEDVRAGLALIAEEVRAMFAHPEDA